MNPAARKFVTGRKDREYTAVCRCGKGVAAFPVGKDDRIPVGYGDAFQRTFASVTNAVAVAVEEERSRTGGLCPGLQGCCEENLRQKRQCQKNRNRFHG